MIKIPGGTCSDLCDPNLKMTRRDLLRVGGAGMLGLSLGSLFKLQALAGEPGKRGRRPRLGQGQERGHDLSPGRPQPSRSVGSEGECAGQHAQPFQAHPDQDPRRPLHRDPARAGEGERQVHHDPLDELHAQRPVQSHRRHLPDHDRLHDRQGQPLRPARAARPEGFPQFRLANRAAAARRPSRCCRS